MKISLLIFCLLGILACNDSKSKTTDEIAMERKVKPLTYLALGDSYTIGEGVEEEDRYPNQLIKRLNEETEYEWANPLIVAKTGWTTDELNKGIDKASLKDQPYNLVTLSIGVNNQYRGRSLEEFESGFEQLLLRAIGFAGNLPDHVIVLSIPDWGITPFAEERDTDQEKVASEIDAFNQAKKAICGKYGVHFVEITEEYRIIGAQPEMVVSDKLHPSGLVYKNWSDLIFDRVVKVIYK